MADSPKTEEQKTITISPEQIEELANAITYAKAFASPTRLAVVGALAMRLDEEISVAELGQELNIAPALIERDLRQLEEAGLISVTEWTATRLAMEPQPARVRFNLDYLKVTAGVISALHQLQAQAQPTTERAKLDERARTLSRFMKDGKVVTLPVGFKRQMYIIEEVAKAFAPNRTYTEREVDAILKGFYDDHCTLRRFLVDAGMMHREAGVYWKS
jgi:DNA-binding transcriptional regulator YhcF (GntR family)